MRTALVTGASRGIGRAIAAEMAAAGWNIVAPSRAELDLGDPASVAAYCKQLRDGEAIDALVNNAGINIINPLADLLEEDLASMIQINVTAPMLLTKAVAPGMARCGWGRILNIGSVFGIVSRSGRAAYSATKAAIIGLTRTSAIELGPQGVLVNALCPGYVETDLTYVNNSPAEIDAIKKTIPVSRLAKPQEIARVAAFLCSEANSYISGQSIIVDGGFTCL
ncbi:MAG TPA: SDR family oxidoreductase [Chthoniobacteraceae bacterium]|nr:SDR family oxidoreductase [Chthoniobacteraceae bacterium]